MLTVMDCLYAASFKCLQVDFLELKLLPGGKEINLKSDEMSEWRLVRQAELQLQRNHQNLQILNIPKTTIYACFPLCCVQLYSAGLNQWFTFDLCLPDGLKSLHFHLQTLFQESVWPPGFKYTPVTFDPDDKLRHQHKWGESIQSRVYSM